MLDIFLTALYLLGHGFSLNLKLTDSSRLSVHTAPGIIHSLSPPMHSGQAFYAGARNRHPRSHT